MSCNLPTSLLPLTLLPLALPLPAQLLAFQASADRALVVAEHERRLDQAGSKAAPGEGMADHGAGGEKFVKNLPVCFQICL